MITSTVFKLKFPSFHEYAYPDFDLSEIVVCCTLRAEEIAIAIVRNRVASCAHIHTLDATMTVRQYNGTSPQRPPWGLKKVAVVGR